MTDQPLSAGELQRRAVSGSAWTLLHALVSLPAAFVANAVVARSLGAASYGRLAFLTAAFTLALTASNFGFSTALIQRGSRAEAAGDARAADALLRRSLGFHLVVELPLLTAIALTLTAGRPWWQAAAVVTAAVASCTLGGASLSLTIQARTATAARLAMATALGVQAASVAAALLTHSPSAVWAVRTMIPALALAFSFPLLDSRRRGAALRPRLPGGLGRPFWRYAAASWAAGLLGLLVFSRSEIFLLEAFHKPAALGAFALAFGLSQQITAPVDAMLHALLPAVAGVLSAWPERAAQAFDRATRLASVTSGALAASVVPALTFAVPAIYGQSFGLAEWLFVPLASISLAQSVCNPVVAFVNARERGGLILKANAAALVVDVALAVALIPQFGAWGAVAANVGGQAIGLGVLAATEPLVRQRSRRELGRLVGPFSSGLLVGCAVLVLGRSLELPDAVLAGFALAVGGVLYVVAVRILGSGLTVSDRDALLAGLGGRTRPYARAMLGVLTAAQPAA